jgi:uroporphyrinogen III methyltransferase/synthase
MSKIVLITAAREDASGMRELLEERDLNLYSFPLERYVPIEDNSAVGEVFERLADFENIVYGSSLNARFFINQVEQKDVLKMVRNRVNLTLNQETAALLEDHGVPAICTFAEGKAINAVEFMLRLRRMGATLYPCGSHQKEELPGLLNELDIAVEELELYNLEGPLSEDLKRYQSKLTQQRPDIILFHSRRSVNRTLAAFPEFDYSETRVISADKGITRHLEEKNITVTDEAEGSWQSMADLL